MPDNATKQEEWTVAEFVRMLSERFAINRDASTIYRWINTGARLRNGETRRLGSKEIGGVIYVTMEHWNQFRS